MIVLKAFTKRSTPEVNQPDEKRKFIEAIFNPAPSTYQETDILGLDCEMVEVEGGKDALARISIVNYYGQVYMDTFVKPNLKITDYRTWVSGVAPVHMDEKALPYETIRYIFPKIAKNKILVGHALMNDFNVLDYRHPETKIRDTQKYRKYTKGMQISLKRLCMKHLGTVIQNGAHNSIEDARAAMALYRLEEEDWEQNMQLQIILLAIGPVAAGYIQYISHY